MAPEKVTVMILDVDLKCPCCYKKVKKVLCKFPQIRDQVFDEDKNKVKITVVCCNPEKMRDKLCCKGGKAIQRIEIVEDPPKPKPKPTPPPAVVVPPPAKPKPDPPKQDPPKPDPPKQDPPKPVPPKADPPKPEPPKADPPKPEQQKKPAPAPAPPAEPQPLPMYEYPQPFCPPAYPVSTCCQECYEGRDGGPCHFGYGRPVPPPPGPCYDGYGYQYGGNRPCYVTRCDYFSEENPQGCSIM